jgi:glucose-6-phosphate isomerase
MSAFRQTISAKARAQGFDSARDRARIALDGILAEAKSGKLHALSIAEESADLAPAIALATRLRREAEHIVVLGIGGSSLGAQAVAQLHDYYTPASFLPVHGPRLHFLDNPDGPTMSRLMTALPVDRTHYLVVSKSGGTVEPMMQVLAAIDHIATRGNKNDVAKLVHAVSEPKDNALTRLARAHGLSVLDHPTDIGGRYAVLSVVGLLPTLLMGLDAKALRAGAAKVLADARAGKADALLDGAAFSTSAAEAGLNVQVLMPYSDRLERFAAWYRQLWAESLGKDGRGTLPVRALGPVDQHSQLQFYLGGTPLAAFTVMTVDQSGAGPRVPASLIADPELGYLKDKRIGDLVMAEARATYETFESNKRPCRLIAIDKLDEAVLGALFMHFMIETIVTARLIGVNPFDQPAVEEGKVLARRYMQEVKSKD